VINEYGKSTGELHSYGKTEELGEKAVPVPFCPSQIPWDRTGSPTLFLDKKIPPPPPTTTTTTTTKQPGTITNV